MPFQVVKLTDPIQFTNVAGGLVPRGAYNAGTDYAVGDSVDYQGSSYVMHTDAGAGTLPTNTSFWQVLANKGDTGATGATGAPGPAGSNGTNGTNGADGADGADGVDGKTVLNGTVDPTTEGVDGDFYINTVSDEIFGPKTAGVWGTGTSLVGPAGADGTDGNFAGRTLTGTTNQVVITNGDGVSGNPTFALPQNIHTGATPTFAGLLTTGDISPTTDSTRSLGTSLLYYANTYTDRLYLNATADFNGSVAGTANLTGNLGIAATSGSAPQALTLGSTAASSGIALYNTADQTTNFERFRTFWSGNGLFLYNERGGTGLFRNITISAFSSTGLMLRLNNGTTTGMVDTVMTTGEANGIAQRISGTLTASSALQYGISIAQTINQSGTAGYTALLINPTETTVGSGNRLLADFQVGGTSMFRFSSDGVQTINGATPTFRLTTSGNFNGFVGIVSGSEAYRVGQQGHSGFNVYTGSSPTRAMSINSSQATTFYADVTVPDEAYGISWDGSLEVPTKNALFDQIETISGGSAPNNPQILNTTIANTNISAGYSSYVPDFLEIGSGFTYEISSNARLEIG